MKQERFNKLPIKEQELFIKQQLRGQVPGFINVLAFKTKCIYYILKPGGGLRKALMQPLPDDLPLVMIHDILRDQHTLNIPLDEQCGLQQIILDKLNKLN